jgi:hypothetical protein
VLREPPAPDKPSEEWFGPWGPPVAGGPGLSVFVASRPAVEALLCRIRGRGPGSRPRRHMCMLVSPRRLAGRGTYGGRYGRRDICVRRLLYKRDICNVLVNMSLNDNRNLSHK